MKVQSSSLDTVNKRQERKMEETRHERFQRIAESRTNRIIDQLRLLGNCSNRSNYEYSEDEVKKIFSAIESEIRAQKSRFASVSRTGRFSL